MIAGVSIFTAVLTLAIGAVIGISGGLFGIGGALVATPLLKLLLDMPAMLALATPLPVALPSALSGSVAYYRSGLICFPVVRRVLLVALPANVLGTWLTAFVPGTVMMMLTGGFIVVVGGTFFVRGWLLREHPDAPTVTFSSSDSSSELTLYSTRILCTGAVAGFLAGFLAIGGGLVMVPAFVRALRMGFKQASATSLFCVAVLSVPASIGHFWLGHIDWRVALGLTVTAVPMAYLGARAAIRLRNRVLERAYGTFMIAFALYFLLRMW
jgi:uncharacterized protein